jgi:membrane protease YdiL (CAAX protease family)
MLSKRPWQPELVLMFVASLFVSFCFAGIASLLLQKCGVTIFKSPDSFPNLLLSTLSMQGVAWVFIYIFLKLHQVGWRDAFGLSNPDLKKSLWLAGGVLLPTLLVLWPLQALCAFVLDKLGCHLENQRAVEMMLNAQSPGAIVYFSFFAVVIAPVAEEFIFRGMLFPLVKQLGWPKLAWFGVSFLFALIHVDAAIFLPLFVLALVLTWLYEKTDCLLAPILVHSLFNAANLVLLLVEIHAGNSPGNSYSPGHS